MFAGHPARSFLIDDAAALLGVSRRTIYYWIRRGRLTTVRTRGGSQRVLLGEGVALHAEPLPLQVEPLPGDAEGARG